MNEEHGVAVFFDVFLAANRVMYSCFEDAVSANHNIQTAYSSLKSDMALKECENELVVLFEYDGFGVVKLLTANRTLIVC